MPRPKIWGPTIGLRLKLDDDAILRQRAEARGIPPAELAREMILAALRS